jgi:hypothetical protein
MPEDFIACEKAGGKMITKSLSGGKYIHLCKDKSGNWHKGEVKEGKSAKISKKLKSMRKSKNA